MDEQNWGITPCNTPMDISPANGFVKLNLEPEQKIQVGALLQHLPSVAATNKASQLYTVTFPEGVTGKLMELKNTELTGKTTAIIGDNGKIKATAALNPAVDRTQVLAMGCFSAMAIASSQYFLKEINDQMKIMQIGIDKILEFLYGDKKAELMAEISFVRYAYENYISIMAHDEQRTAMIGSLHEARKVAMKDIEFYINDLDSTAHGKDEKDISGMADKAFQLKESLEFSMQLYGMSSLLEVYYAQNYDANYLEYVEKDISAYIDKCEKRMLGSFSALKVSVDGAKGSLFKKVDTAENSKQIDMIVDRLGSGEESDMRKSLRSVLKAATRKTNYYMTTDGVVYLKTA